MYCLLGYQRTYYWCVGAILKDGPVVKGDIWTFTTGERHVRPVLEVVEKDREKVRRSRNEDYAP